MNHTISINEIVGSIIISQLASSSKAGGGCKRLILVQTINTNSVSSYYSVKYDTYQQQENIKYSGVDIEQAIEVYNNTIL